MRRWGREPSWYVKLVYLISRIESGNMPFCMHEMKCLFHISNISTIATQGRVVEEDLSYSGLSAGGGDRESTYLQSRALDKWCL